MDADPRPTLERARVRVRGAVQGVGFRPFVTGLARDLGLTGWVLNDADGVLLEIEGGAVARFLETLSDEPPPLARIDAVEVTPTPPQGETGFTIRPSVGGAARTAITPDAPTCPACLDDIADPTNRRHRYAFTNCTHCGPRYTITRALPYDRAKTSMADFEMCPACGTEYADETDRRFHAQPNACPECGPQLSHDVETVLEAVARGEIVALKGLGGFHLIVDARNEEAVASLRARKGRDGKPFAVMVADRAAAEALATLSPAEVDVLEGRVRPVVVARAKPGAGLASSVSDGLPTVGVFTPYTPLHTLLFTTRPDPGRALVMTSANLSGDPLIIDNEEAHARLAGVADLIVTHNRGIVVRCDDSVVRVINGAPAYLRRARGATPEPIKLARAVPDTLAVGGHLKNTVCITRGDEAFLSQHIGDLDRPTTFEFFEEVIAHLTAILEVTPTRIAHDRHPEFLSTRYAHASGLPTVAVQHHHAHIAAVAAEHRLEGPVIGLALDGFGLGDGDASWGGELLRVDGPRFTRIAGLHPLAQPGGDAAARAPWRMGAAALHALGLGDAIPDRFADHEGAPLIAAMLDKGVNAPLTSSAGRLFDAACGLLGVRPTARFEGEAPMALEGLVTALETPADAWRITEAGALDLRPLLGQLLDCDPETGANRFHGGFAAALVAWTLPHVAATAADKRGGRHVALSGGCLQNKVLAEALVSGFAAHGVTALLPAQAPANDGGLSLGQAWIAALTPLDGDGEDDRCA